MKIPQPPIHTVGAAITMMPHADALIAESSRFAERLGAKLTLIQTGATQAEKTAYLDELSTRLAISHEAHVVETPTDPAHALLDAAEQARIELLIAGAFEGLALGRRRYLGPVARQLAERARCSVLLVAHPRLGAYDFGRIVVITDFSDCAKRACEHALWLAEKDGAESVHIVSVHTIFMKARAELGAHGDASARTRDEEERLLGAFISALPDCDLPVKWKVIDATTGFAACDCADALEADLLVLPGRNRPGGRVPPMVDWALQIVPCSLWIVHEGTAWSCEESV